MASFKSEVNHAAKSNPAFDGINSVMIADEFGFDPAYVLAAIKAARGEG
jgi:hypothetical protein